MDSSSDSSDEEQQILGMGADLFEEDQHTILKRQDALGRREQLLGRSWGTANHTARWAEGAKSTQQYLLRDSSASIQYIETPGQQLCVWDCALVLSRYLEKNKGLVKGRSVMELGCGLGLPGLVAGALGATKVALTDRPAVVPTLRQELESNAKALSGVQATAYSLDWSDTNLSTRESAGTFDVILCSDLVYAGDADTTADLVKTIVALQSTSQGKLVEGSLVVSCHELRHHSSSGQAQLLTSLLEGNGYTAEPVSHEHMDEEYQDPTIHITVFKPAS